MNAVVHDVSVVSDVPRALAASTHWLGGVDVLIYAPGIMPSVAVDEYDADKDAAIFAVNLVGAAAWLDAVAPLLVANGGGTLVGIGSVAGERGRMGNPAYCASKAGLHALLEALRNRLDRHGVVVITVKPGPVRTPMVEGRTDLPLLIEADVAASRILAAIDAGQRSLFVPWAWGPIMAVIRGIPSWLFRRMTL